MFCLIEIFTRNPSSSGTVVPRQVVARTLCRAIQFDQILGWVLAAVFSICCAVALHAQSPVVQAGGASGAPPMAPQVPIYIEGLIGNDRFDLQSLIEKRFTPTSKLSLLSVTSAASTYKNNLNSFDFINTTQIAYDLKKGFGVNAGISMNAKIGFNPTVGVQYVYGSPTLVVVVSPSVFLTTDHDFQSVTVVQYQPRLSPNWKLYTSLAGLADYDVDAKLNARDYLHTRVGVSYRLLTFGFGSDFDWYGVPTNTYRSNFGPFLGYSF